MRIYQQPNKRGIVRKVYQMIIILSNGIRGIERKYRCKTDRQMRVLQDHKPATCFDKYRFSRGAIKITRSSACVPGSRRVKGEFHRSTELISFHQPHPVSGIPAAGSIIFDLPDFLNFFTSSDRGPVGEVNVFYKPQIVGTWLLQWLYRWKVGLVGISPMVVGRGGGV